MPSADGWESQRRLPPSGGLTRPPVIRVLDAGSRLWRIHRHDRAGDEFSVAAPTLLTGGRFDCEDGAYGVLYAGESFRCAVAEAVLRTTPLVGTGERIVPFARARGRVFSALETRRDLRLVSLGGADAAAVGQGLWLTKSDAVDYALTRAWGRALHDCSEVPDGLLWRARFDEDEHSMVLFGDRCEDGLATIATVPIDSGEGLEAVRRALLDHSAALEGGAP